MYTFNTKNTLDYFRFFKLILQLISRYQTWAEDASVKSKTDLKDFGCRIKFLEDLENDLKKIHFKLNDIYLMFEKLLLSEVTVEVLELLKSKCSKTCKVICLIVLVIFSVFFR